MTINHMKWIALLLIVVGVGSTGASGATSNLAFACAENNDLYVLVHKSAADVQRFDSPADAIAKAPEGSGVLILADQYPERPVQLDPALLDQASAKHLKLYIEFPEALPGVTFGETRSAVWERLVVATGDLGDALPKMRIMMAHECRYRPATGIDQSLLVIARVAGYDSAIYGLPKEQSPILFKMPERDVWIATTKLSQFVTGRYAPQTAWSALWNRILQTLAPDATIPPIKFEPVVGSTLKRDEPVTPAIEKEAMARAANWLVQSRLLITPAQMPGVEARLKQSVDDFALVADGAGADGTLGILEGFSSGILPDGSQLQRQPIRDDCQLESAMVLSLSDNEKHRQIAKNLVDFALFTSDMQRNNPRGDPKHPSFGLIAWGSISPAWLVANYGDDNARSILGAIVASAALKTDRWDESLLAALYANLRTTGTLGFRGDRVDQPPLEAHGWKHFHDAATVNPAPHFEAYLWACYLWAYQQTKDAEFLTKTETAIKMTMEAYAQNGWRWNSNIERARMLLPLAWLVRVDDKPIHREWLQTIAKDLIKIQDACGAIPEQLGKKPDGSFFSAPQSNEAYGVGETPLVQETTDPVSDQLYTTGFALLALREASVATDDAFLRDAENKLAAYLCRIQTKSAARPEFDGWWFRAFDFDKWEAWASSADIGWGAWSLEAGWAQAWTAATLSMRNRETSVWDFTKGSTIETKLDPVKAKLAQNDGSPLVRP